MAKFATSLLPRPEEHDIVRINYFTARIKYNPAEPHAAFDQDRYLEVLSHSKKRLHFLKSALRRRADFGILTAFCGLGLENPFQ